MRTLLPYVVALTPFLLNATSKTNSIQDSEKISDQNVCHSPFHRTHFDIRHTEANGVGYKDGYTTAEWFGILDHNSYFMPFLDLRGHVFNNGKLAGNIGLGERTIIPSINHAFGLYCYYDIRQEDHGLTVHQISPGIELLGKRMEYRMNGYFPVGRTESHHYGKKFARFQGHSILMKRKKKFAMTGGDAELGVHVTQSTRHDVYAGAGPYYFTADSFSSWGGKARLLWRYKDYISLEASYSYDQLFHNVFQGTVGLSYPLGKKLERKGKYCSPFHDLTLSRTAFAPYRFEIPVVKKHHHHTHAINPATGQPWKVWFVNNTSHSLGTFESPFPTLAEAQSASGPNDMIYIFSGDGTSKGMNQGIVLQNGQKLLGSSIVQTIPTIVGSLQIPPMSPQRPILTNTLGAGTVVLLANGNEVAGLDIKASVNNCTLIQAPAQGVNGGSIHDNILSGLISHRTINIIGNGVFFVQNNTCLDLFIGSPFQAIRFDVFNSNEMTAFITNNFISGYEYSIGVNTQNQSKGIFEISNNTIVKTETLDGAGIFIGASGDGIQGKSLQANVYNNKLKMLSDTGIVIGRFAAPEILCVNIENNMIDKTGDGNGITIINPASGTQFKANIKNNLIEEVGNGYYGISATAGAGSTLCIDILNNTAPSGYQFINSGGSFYLAPFINNTGNITKSGNITTVSANSCSCD